MISTASVSRILSSTASGILGVVIPLTMFMRPVDLHAGLAIVETGIVATTGAYWLLVRSAHRQQRMVASA